MLMGKPSDKLTSPTVNLPSGETVIIEEEYPHNIPQQNTRYYNIFTQTYQVILQFTFKKFARNKN